MRYEKARLGEREWHKVIMWTEIDSRGLHRLAFRAQIKEAITRLTTQPCMHRSGQDWNLIMIASDEDYVALKLALNIRPDEYRGFGDWAKKRYSSAASNRIMGARSEK